MGEATATAICLRCARCTLPEPGTCHPTCVVGGQSTFFAAVGIHGQGIGHRVYFIRSAGRRAPATSFSTVLATATMPKLAVTIIAATKPPAQSSLTPSPTKPLYWHTLPSGLG